MRSAVSVLVSVLFILCGMQLFAETCYDAIRAKVQSNNPQVEKVAFDDGSEASTPAGKDTEARKGRGQFLRHTGKWEEIAWTCSYDTRNNRVRTADYSVVTEGRAIYQADTSKGWPKNCQEKLRTQVNDEHKNAQKVGFKSATETQYTKTEKLLYGEGFWERQDGVKKEFSYWCVFNTRTDQISERDYRAEP